MPQAKRGRVSGLTHLTVEMEVEATKSPKWTRLRSTDGSKVSMMAPSDKLDLKPGTKVTVQVI